MSIKFKSSYYNYLFKNNNQYYVYNTLSTAIAEINSEIYENLENNYVNNISDEYKENLFQQGFIVSENANEKDYYRYFYENARYAYSSRVLVITFIPTYDCNLRCPYCYEGNNKSKEKISQNDINKILDFISSEISNSKIPIAKLQILLFGGEPLMCKDELIYFCNSTSDIAKKFNIKTEYSMVTNLTIVDTDIINMISKHKIMTQVSIDGTKDEHNMRRIYADGSGTYDIIIKNLEKLIDNGFKDLITIRINIDEANTENANEIFRCLKKYSNDIYFGILRSYKGFNDNYNQNCLKWNCADNIAIEKLHDIYSDNGFDVPQKFGKKGPCGLNAQNRYIIDNKLDVYKCDLLVNNPECRVGYINKTGNFVKEANFYQQMSFSPFLFDKCLDCKLVPLCGAGCPAEKYLEKQLENGNIIHKNCSFTEESLKNYLLDYIKRLE